jgi:hypothetical protein
MTRLFTFGCSFTNYRWSTWADCLAPEFDYFENWGQSGAGNHYIFNSVMEADQRHQFGPNDTVIVCWTNVLREDRYYQDRWITLGAVANTPIYTKEFIADVVCPKGFLIRDIAMVKATKILLESRLANWKFLSMLPLDIEEMWEYLPNIAGSKEVKTLYKDVFDSMLPSFREILRPRGWHHTDNGTHFPKGHDAHPTPAEHLMYLDKVLPGWVTKQETRVKIATETTHLRKDPHRDGMCRLPRL